MYICILGCIPLNTIILYKIKITFSPYYPHQVEYLPSQVIHGIPDWLLSRSRHKNLKIVRYSRLSSPISKVVSILNILKISYSFARKYYDISRNYKYTSIRWEWRNYEWCKLVVLNISLSNSPSIYHHEFGSN